MDNLRRQFDALMEAVELFCDHDARQPDPGAAYVAWLAEWEHRLGNLRWTVRQARQATIS